MSREVMIWTCVSRSSGLIAVAGAAVTPGWLSDSDLGSIMTVVSARNTCGMTSEIRTAATMLRPTMAAINRKRRRKNVMLSERSRRSAAASERPSDLAIAPPRGDFTTSREELILFFRWCPGEAPGPG